MSKKRYIVFSGLDFYPAGGGLDFNWFCPTIEDAKNAAIEALADNHDYWIENGWSHIFDTEECVVIYEYLKRDGEITVWDAKGNRVIVDNNEQDSEIMHYNINNQTQ